MQGRFPVIAVIGSMGYPLYNMIAKELTFRGYIVIQVDTIGKHFSYTKQAKYNLMEDALIEMLYAKIDMADYLFILNDNSQFTEIENKLIEYAKEKGIPLQYESPPKVYNEKKNYWELDTNHPLPFDTLWCESNIRKHGDPRIIDHDKGSCIIHDDCGIVI